MMDGVPVASTVDRPAPDGVSAVASRSEASVRLVGTAVFKTDEGARVPWRVRFPSASANSSPAPRGRMNHTTRDTGVGPFVPGEW